MAHEGFRGCRSCRGLKLGVVGATSTTPHGSRPTRGLELAVVGPSSAFPVSILHGIAPLLGLQYSIIFLFLLYSSFFPLQVLFGQATGASIHQSIYPLIE